MSIRGNQLHCPLHTDLYKDRVIHPFKQLGPEPNAFFLTISEPTTGNISPLTQEGSLPTFGEFGALSPFCVVVGRYTEVPFNPVSGGVLVDKTASDGRYLAEKWGRYGRVPIMIGMYNFESEAPFTLTFSC